MFVCKKESSITNLIFQMLKYESFLVMSLTVVKLSVKLFRLFWLVSIRWHKTMNENQNKTWNGKIRYYETNKQAELPKLTD